MFRSAILAALFGLIWYAAHAGDIYRWVDGNGRVHFSDSVPDEFKKSATRMDSSKYEISEEQRLRAQQRAAEDAAKARAQEDARGRAAEKEAQAASQAAAAAKGAPRATAGGSIDCEEQHRRYRESITCFAPYVTAQGAVRAEAYGKCETVSDPGPVCGPSKAGARPNTTRTY